MWTIASILVQLEWIYQAHSGLAEDRRRWFRRPPPREAERSPPRSEASVWQRLLDAELSVITQAFDIDPPRVVASEYVPNAASDGTRILLNPTWAREVTEHICKHDGPCREALFRGIAGHELAHHMRERRVVADQHAEELRADTWAATVLTRLGTSVEPYRRLVGEGEDVPSRSHPAPSDRIRAIDRGRLRLPLVEIRAAGSRSARPMPTQPQSCCLASSHPLAQCVC